MGQRSDDPPGDPRWSEAARLATQLDRILDRFPPHSEARAAAIDDLAARLKRTPQTIRSYLRKYGQRRLVRDLLRDDSGRGPRLPPETEGIVKTILDQKHLTPEGCSLNEAMIVINGRLEQAGLKPVSFNTVKSRLWKHWTAEEVARRRGDRTAARKHRRRGGALVPDYPLQVCQIDETEIDVLAVDDEGNLLRRLWVIVLVDVLTHMILGFWLWPRSANREAIGLCIQHAIRPKGAYFQKFGIEATDVFGRPERIISDRAAWYKSLQDNRSLEDLRVVVEPRRGEPHIRGVVERLQGSINQQLRKGRGQTGRSVADRGDYPAKERACLTYEQIETAVAITAFRICNGEMDEKTRKRPDLEWGKHACRIPEHLLTVDWEAVQLAFLPERACRLSSKGIPAFGLTYWEDEDPRLAELYANRGRESLRIKVNRNDVSHIYVRHPSWESWVAVPRADGLLTPLTAWEWEAQKERERAEAETSWMERGKSREMVDAALTPTAGTGRKPRVSRKAASEAVAARVAGDAPKPHASEMALNRLKTSGDGLGRLPVVDDCFDVEPWGNA
ncbi:MULTISPECIES: integrase catalytic domain-containing protein [Azospirillum]|uniref:DDE-type integrase/transposase/recombinase n=1 Tax=Azospirillum brasilense TaxID=192 RepID=A0ABU4PEF3_AZOBR|nr:MULTISPECIES: DDE-type integrase/transposase/recombinase [Azospirillum]ALJ39407.1 hypothetical protein AMK58_28310 [Azospirillum brasilense]MDX5955980.1 DDE-type integrase/transposase/recombinase [Azospirillum brasilense]PWC88187.1 hypothetical protein AEJ54_24555 [Azospirillum sp. Sp 7]